MGDRQNGGARLGGLFKQQIKNADLAVRIKVAGRFVRQDQFGLCDQRAADGDALLFSLTEGRGVTVQLVADTASRRQRLRPVAGLCVQSQCGRDPIGVEDILRADR